MIGGWQITLGASFTSASYRSARNWSSFKRQWMSGGPPSARQRCWRRRQPRKVGVVEKMWRSGGENEVSTGMTATIGSGGGADLGKEGGGAGAGVDTGAITKGAGVEGSADGDRGLGREI